GLAKALDSKDETSIAHWQEALKESDDTQKQLKKDAVSLIKKNNPTADTSDVNYVFLRFVLDRLPIGLIGLLIAVIFSASMGSIAAAYNSLASTTVVDLYKRVYKTDASDNHYLMATRISTIGWGIFCIFVAQYASKLGSMIEAVNILGSLFYGVILGIFLVAFYFKNIGGKATFWGAIVAEIGVVLCWWYDLMAFLWLNVVGCVFVIAFAWVIQKLKPANA
ncbi:MAG TPA: sodium:solute symporter, partial [Runella sp.]|nr:sodium:solute symporter [Runella sp.]